MTRACAVVTCLIVSCGPGSGRVPEIPPGGKLVHIERVEQEAEPRTDRCLAPYLWVPGSGDVEGLPLESSSARIEIAGVIARVTVTQVFRNGGEVPIEAEYVFPGSTRAAVHGMRMRIGERTVEARIEERKKAKATYEAAKTEGKVASLLEQERRNVFTMRVANIMPGARIEVELEYSELLVPEDGTYELVYPTVVAPRYGGGASPVDDLWIETPYTPEGEPEPYDVSVDVALETGIPFMDLSSPSHDLDVEILSDTAARARPAGPAGNRDFVLRYRLADEAIETGLIVDDEGGGGTFAVMLEPPPRPRPDQVTPREYIFVMDVSGSMSGFPIEVAKALMRELLAGLGPEERFVLFAGSSFRLSDEPLPATGANVEMALDVVDNAPAGGGTELMQALENAYAVPRTDRTSRTIVVVTDGFVGVEAESYKLVRESLGRAGVFAFGIGTSVNRDLIEGLARAGMGEPFVVLDEGSAMEEARRFRSYIDSPVLTGVSVAFEGMSVHDVLPDPAAVPDVLASRPVVLVGRYVGEPAGRIVLRGRSAGGDFERSIEVAKGSPGTAPLRALWARRWVDLYEDELKMHPGDPSLEKSVIGLGLSHSLLTSLTSFVAVDSEVVNKMKKLEKVDQPLPMPEGVSSSAVGGGDADADGIPDGADSCPFDPEVYNGIDDADGCPDQGKVEI
jgi:Ca-activated chloride channel family protein